MGREAREGEELSRDVTFTQPDLLGNSGVWIAPKICLNLKQGGWGLNSGICKSWAEGCPLEVWAHFLASGKIVPISQAWFCGGCC